METVDDRATSEAPSAASVLSLQRGLTPLRLVLALVAVVLSARSAGVVPIDVRVLLCVAGVGSLWFDLWVVQLRLPARGSPNRLMVVRLALDLVLALGSVLLADPRATPLVWVALLVPVLGAATFSPRAAIVMWVVVSLSYTAARIVWPGAADTSFLVGLQQLGAAGMAGVPLAMWSRRVTTSLRDTSRSRQRSMTQARVLRDVAGVSRRLSAQTDVAGIDDVVMDLGRAVGAVRTELWTSGSAGRWVLQRAAGGAVSSTTQVGLSTAIDDPGLVVMSETDDPPVGGEIHRGGHRLAVAYGLGQRGSAVCRMWFGENRLSEERRDALEVGLATARQVYSNVLEMLRLQAWSAELEERASTDHLTGALNRSGLADSLAGHSDDQPLGVLYLDLNRFKVVNDTHGHDIGDRVLSAVCGRFRGCVTDTMLLARIGGDEFVAVAMGEDVDLLDNAHSALASSLDAPIVIDGLHLDLGVSIGRARTRDGGDFKQLLREADASMYEAKALLMPDGD